MAYVVQFDAHAKREFDRLPLAAQGRILPAIQSLADNPRPPRCKKLTARGREWRIREGDYRIIYEIRDDVVLVTVTRIAWRDKAYR